MKYHKYDVLMIGDNAYKGVWLVESVEVDGDYGDYLTLTTRGGNTCEVHAEFFENEIEKHIPFRSDNLVYM